MRAGDLTETITIERVSTVLDANRAPVETWVPLATVRAGIVTASTEEFIRGRGAASETSIVFRIRFVDDLTLADRVIYYGEAYNLKDMRELGRARGLDIRVERAGP
ncbi:head-tail adaptor protein [Tardiphaga sp. vice352]|uniref:phage head closure protein n=1 Tax=unclassified Tardiphaga TaxID=2631404 RepID=UPI0011652E6D|nr:MULTISPECIES: phage head closure protein [unclassified Tardiphaga]QDM16739.1 head-tail adaptor protein [Tardiphaga sp. vice278]QDM32014.1 head-tail adaptor protein [Tardiphaga sp. vice352]